MRIPCSALRAPCLVARSKWTRTFSSVPKPSSAQWRVILLSGITASAAAYYFYWPHAPRGASAKVGEPLSPSWFIPVKITSCTDTTHDTKLLTLTVPPHLRPPVDSPALTPIWSIYVKDDELQIERPYTPLEGIDPQGRMAFWIKRYQNGEVGRWLHSKKVGDSVEIRGPVRTWEWRDGVWDEVVLVSKLLFNSGGYFLTGRQDIRRHGHNPNVPVAPPGHEPIPFLWYQDIYPYPFLSDTG
jgi:cytochrome-b5 reductase